MGASNRGRERAPRPCPVWIIDTWTGSTGPHPPQPGILVDWRRVTPTGCAPHWEGLVITASGGGERRWQALVAFSRSGELEVRWFYDTEIAPVAERPPVR